VHTMECVVTMIVSVSWSDMGDRLREVPENEIPY
jgi:hypothetical protein